MEKAQLRTFLFDLGVYTALSGLILSRVLLSIGMGLLILQAILNTDLRSTFREFLNNRSYLYPTLVFFIFLISGLWSADSAHFWQRMQVKLPFLLLPWAVFSGPGVSRRKMNAYLAFFILLVTIAAFASLGYYLLHYSEVTEEYLRAKTIRVPFNHIRFSLMCAFSALAAFHLYRQRFILLTKNAPRIYLGLAVFLVLFLHILSVRSGLMALYLGALYTGIRYFYLKKKKKEVLIFLLVTAAIPIVAYLTVPTFHNKIKYMIYDLEQYASGGDISQYSDSRRLTSWEAGIATGNKAPLIGVGYGDFKTEVFDYYSRHYPDYDPKMYIIPHNQLITVYASTGLIGLLFFCFFLLYPVFKNRHYRYYPLALINIIIWSSFLVESTLEIQIGTAFYLLFFLLSLKAVSGEMKHT